MSKFLNKIYRQQFAILILALMVMATFPVSALSKNPQRQISSQAEREESIERCKQPAYIEIDGRIFEVPREGFVGVSVEKRMVQEKCSSTHKTPFPADSLSLRVEANLFPGYGEPAHYQIQIDTLNLDSKVSMRHIKQDLDRKGMDIEALPRQGSFYVYSKVKFISAVDDLKEFDGDPLILSCGAPHGAFDCSTVFKWKGPFTVSFRSHYGPKNIPVEEWHKLFPILLAYLEKIDVTDQRREP